MQKIISLLLIFLLVSCTSVGRFGTGVDITFDPRTIGMQIDDTIMQKNLSARLALTDKRYFLSIQSEVIVGRIFLSGKVDKPEEKIKWQNSAAHSHAGLSAASTEKKLGQAKPAASRGRDEPTRRLINPMDRD